MSVEFDPQVVARIVANALEDRKVLPMTFIETTLFDRLSSLLSKYMNEADVIWVISQLRSEFLSGFTHMTSSQLQTIIHNCVKCPSTVKPPTQARWNLDDPDLLLIVPNPNIIEQYGSDLVNALKRAGFNSSRCALSYVTRCSASQLTEDIITQCIPYLHTEIAILNPKLILTLGKVCYSALTGNDVAKLNDVRGQILYFGPYAVLPENSLGALQYLKESDSDAEAKLDSSLNLAYKYIYGGNP